MMSGEPTKAEIAELVESCGETMKGGELQSARWYSDADGEQRLRVQIDYGIKGTKQFDASQSEMDKAAGRADPSLEDLGQPALGALMREYGVSIEGRFNRVKAIVAIRKAIAAQAKAAVEEAMAASAEAEKPKAVPKSAPKSKSAAKPRSSAKKAKSE